MAKMSTRRTKLEIKEEQENSDLKDGGQNGTNPASTGRQMKKFMKISSLMTEEQKEAIERYYKIDMSVVVESKVKEKMLVLKESPKTVYMCKICEAMYPRFDKCQVHVWGHLDMKPFRCKACKYSTITISNIRCHIRKKHLNVKPYKCHLCPKSYTSSMLLEEHLNTHAGARPYTCNDCSFASASKQILVRHVLTHKTVKDVVCDVCGKGFHSKIRMTAHRIIHNKDKAFKCELCTTYVLNEEALQRHYANVHNRDYICPTCNKVFKSGKALQNHKAVHSEAKYECSICGNKYKRSYILKEHMLKHQGIRPYKCKNCDKSFGQQSHLAAHMAVHSDVTFDCPVCKKGFNRHDNMKKHASKCDRYPVKSE